MDFFRKLCTTETECTTVDSFRKIVKGRNFEESVQDSIQVGTWHKYIQQTASEKQQVWHVGELPGVSQTVWNSLTTFVCTADSFTSFRSQLKTYMFTRHL